MRKLFAAALLAISGCGPVGPSKTSAEPPTGFIGEGLRTHDRPGDPLHSQVVVSRSRPQDPTGNSVCGGLLVGRRFVLTAAHCLGEMETRFERDALPEAYAREARGLAEKTVVFFPKVNASSLLIKDGPARTPWVAGKTLHFPRWQDIQMSSATRALFSTESDLRHGVVVLELAEAAPPFVPVFDMFAGAQAPEFARGRLLARGFDTKYILSQLSGPIGVRPAWNQELRFLTAAEVATYLGQRIRNYAALTEAEKQALRNLSGTEPGSLLLLLKTEAENYVCEGDSGSPLFLAKDGRYQVIGLTEAFDMKGKTLHRGPLHCGQTLIYTSIEPVKVWLKKLLEFPPTH